jgi:putative addiction module component (TIGR02574 family)
MTVKDVESAALNLSPRARARLAARLLESLEKPRGKGILDLWADEAERRYNAYKEGRVRAIPAEEVFREARAKLR